MLSRSISSVNHTTVKHKFSIPHSARWQTEGEPEDCAETLTPIERRLSELQPGASTKFLGQREVVTKKTRANLRLWAEVKEVDTCTYVAAGDATAADWLLRSSASAIKPEAFTSSTKAAR